MLKKLTQEQKELMPKIVERFTLSIQQGETDEEKVKEMVYWLYEMSNLQKPEVIVVDSPLAIQYLLNMKEASVGANVGANVWANVRANVWDNVWDNVGDNVRDNVERSKGLFFTFGYYGIQTYDVDWLSFYQYFTEIDVLNDDKFNRYVNLTMDAGIFMAVYLDGLAVVSRKPEYIKRNEQMFMHCIDGPAIRFKDGYELYYLNGVSFSKELFERVTSGEMPYKDIVALQDIDQRTQAMRFGDPVQFFRDMDAKELDQEVKTLPDGTPIGYTLYEVPPKEKVFTQTAYFMMYTCPSTNKQYMSGVPKFDTVADAMAWKQSDEWHTVTPEEWKAMKPLVHES